MKVHQIIIKVNEENTIINSNLQAYNLSLILDLEPYWNTILNETHRFEKEAYLYVQTKYSIPIKGNFFSFMRRNKALPTSSGGVTQIFRLKDLEASKTAIIQASYIGTYDNKRQQDIQASSEIWFCELEQGVWEGEDATYRE